MSGMTITGPTRVYHRTEKPALVTTHAQYVALGPGWADTPAAFYDTAPGAPPEAPQLPQVSQTAGPTARGGCLLNGNPSGDFTTAPRCGAQNRRGLPCQAPAIRGRRRCRLHGGLSTGPKTFAGRKRVMAAVMKHGRYSRIERELTAAMRDADAQARRLLGGRGFFRRLYPDAVVTPPDAVERYRDYLLSRGLNGGNGPAK